MVFQELYILQRIFYRCIRNKIISPSLVNRTEVKNDKSDECYRGNIHKAHGIIVHAIGSKHFLDRNRCHKAVYAVFLRNALWLSRAARSVDNKCKVMLVAFRPV